MKTSLSDARREPGDGQARRSGLTRVDLMAMMGVLCVLALLSVAAARENTAGSRSAACLANLRSLTRAWQQFTFDEGHFPPNPDDGNTTPGMVWVPGEAGPGGAQEFNPDILRDPTRSLLVPYLANTCTNPFHCPSDLRLGRYQGTNAAFRGTVIPNARSYSMNGAIGIDPFVPGLPVPVNGPWLDNNHAHVRGTIWRTYATMDDVVDPSPSQLSVILDEDPISLNDGYFAFGMRNAEWIDWPATYHEMGGTLSFADGHVELHHWLDPRTPVINNNVARRVVPGSPDYAWLRERMSAPFRR